MLTPAKIKSHRFEPAGRNAYKADAVDRFFQEVTESYEQMFRENGEMYKKISLLAERLEEYRNDEDNIRNALLTAQRMSEKIQREAKESAEALVAEAQLNAQNENERVAAETNQMMAQATYQAKSLIEEAQKHAEKIVFDATYESKAAAISARDAMIKEEAALEMMKVEVTKFKKLILDSYNEQIALIEQLPELVYSTLEEEAPAEEEAAAEEPTIEEAEAEVEIAESEEHAEEELYEEPAAVAAFEEVNEEPESVDEPQEDAVDVDTLQQMIEEAVDTDAEDEPYVDDIAAEEAEEPEFTGEFVLPEFDEENDYEHLDNIVNDFADNAQSSGSDVYFSKPQQEDEAQQGFRVNLDKISSYGVAEEVIADDADELDEDFDSDDDESLGSKFKSFFKK